MFEVEVQFDKEIFVLLQTLKKKKKAKPAQQFMLCIKRESERETM